MTPASLFQAALAKTDPVERAGFLDEACGDDVNLRQVIDLLLLAHESPGDFMKQPAGLQGVTLAEITTRSYASTSPTPGVVIAGRYTLEQKLGEGGMGEVWVAKQLEPVKRKVALKLIKPGMDSRTVVQRFEQERQALAMMDHPNIAKVLDGGIDSYPLPSHASSSGGEGRDGALPPVPSSQREERWNTGRPFFVMELVNGLPLTKFCDEAKLGIKERLELFVPICQAVQHAHQKGIVHRDLKPGNILITLVDGKPVPKVIDFGVAKAIGGKLIDESLSTQFGAVIGTLEYMAPEQAGFSNQDVDTRADIYSLGVILYELLTGLRPFDSKRLKKAALDEVIRMIREEEPSKPSTRLSTDDSLPSLAAARHIEPGKLTALLRGELDWVVMKCLEKQRDRRYETANGLAREIQRYLADEAIEARPVSTSYRLLKFYRRNRGAVVAATVVALSLLGGIIGTTWGLLKASAAQAEEAKQKTEAQQQTLIAEGQTRLAEAVNRFLIDDLLEQGIAENQGGSTPRLGRNYPIGAIVDRAAQQISGKFTKYPAVEAEIHLVLGQVYANLAEYAVAKPHLERALQLTGTQRGEEDVKAMEIQAHLGAMLARQGHYAQASPLLEKVLAIRMKVLGEEHRNTIRSLASLGVLRQMQGRLTEASDLHHKSLALRQRLFGDSDVDTMASQSNIGWLLYDQGKPAEAAVRFADVLAKCVSKYGTDYSLTISVRHDLASAYLKMNRLAEAESLSRENLKICRQVYGDRHPGTLYCMNNLGQVRLAQMQVSDAEQWYRKTLELRSEVLGANHPDTLVSKTNLGHLLQYKREHVHAEKLLTEALAGLQRVLGDEHEYTTTALNNLAYAKRLLGQIEDAKKLFLRATQNLDRRQGTDHPSSLQTRRNLAETCIDLKQFTEAEEHLRKVLSSQRTTLKPDDFDLAYTLFLFGGVLKELEKFAEAEAILKECLHIGHTRAPNDWRPFNTRRHLGETLVKLKRYDEAEPVLKTAYDGLSARLSTIPPAFHASREQAGKWLITLYEASGKQDQAEQWRKKVEADLKQKP